jgi:hypothetical protein
LNTVTFSYFTGIASLPAGQESPVTNLDRREAVLNPFILKPNIAINLKPVILVGSFSFQVYEKELFWPSYIAAYPSSENPIIFVLDHDYIAFEIAYPTLYPPTPEWHSFSKCAIPYQED